jgi:UDP-galactopyranose mutase
LRWDFVYQRPQHIMTRLARQRPVLFIEEPEGGASEDGWETHDVRRGLTVHRPRLRGKVFGFERRVHERLVHLLEELVMCEGVARHTAWLYTPLALPVARAIAPEVLVYDCMDELANFRFAPPELSVLENELLHHADVVFTGGPSLYRAKQARHPNVHCFPSSVDVTHFRGGRAGQPIASDLEKLPCPRLGFFGVIDERFDASLIDALARAHPDWQIVLVGPVIKIDRSELPNHPNVHYLGARSYDELPSYLAGWDVCLLPFALNAATRFISPTKTLEYMAAEHPIVSTSIRDVVDPYGDLVYVGDGAEEFVAACERALSASQADMAQRCARMKEVLARTSWDETVRGMVAALNVAEARYAHNGRIIERAVSPLPPDAAAHATT